MYSEFIVRVLFFLHVFRHLACLVHMYMYCRYPIPSLSMPLYNLYVKVYCYFYVCLQYPGWVGRHKDWDQRYYQHRHQTPTVYLHCFGKGLSDKEMQMSERKCEFDLHATILFCDLHTKIRQQNTEIPLLKKLFACRHLLCSTLFVESKILCLFIQYFMHTTIMPLNNWPHQLLPCTFVRN